MVRVALSLIFSLWLTSGVCAGLDVKLDKNQSPLGEPLLLQIKSWADLNEIDLGPLKKDFEIASQTINRSSSHGSDQYLLEATLYPLRSGVLTVPNLILGTLRSQPASIRIQPINISMLAWFPPGMPMEREATVLHLEIRDDGSLSWDTPIQIEAPYAVVRALPESLREETQDGLKRVVHHFRWKILPLKEGSLTVTFEMLAAHRYAQRLRFPVSSVSLNVRAAPAYLPLNLPIGKPTIRVDPRPQHMIAGQPMAWNMYIQVPGLSAEGAKNLLQYTVPAGMRFYAPSIAPVMLDGEEYLHITLSFIGDRTTRIFPAIRLPYFDLQQQRIESVWLPAAPLQVHDPVKERLITASIVIAALVLVALLMWLTWRQWQRSRTKYRWLLHISAAQTPSMLYAALTKDSPWRARTLSHLPSMINIDARAFAELEQVRFGLPHDPKLFPELKKRWEQAIAKIPLRFFATQIFLHHSLSLPDVKSLVLRTRVGSSLR